MIVWAPAISLFVPFAFVGEPMDALSVSTFPESEAGSYLSQGWRRKRERQGLRILKVFGLYIEPDEKI